VGSPGAETAYSGDGIDEPFERRASVKRHVSAFYGLCELPDSRRACVRQA
jgi:hypothetical protein